jgi:hypothetical protein
VDHALRLPRSEWIILRIPKPGPDGRDDGAVIREGEHAFAEAIDDGTVTPSSVEMLGERLLKLGRARKSPPASEDGATAPEDGDQADHQGEEQNASPAAAAGQRAGISRRREVLAGPLHYRDKRDAVRIAPGDWQAYCAGRADADTVRRIEAAHDGLCGAGGTA